MERTVQRHSRSRSVYLGFRNRRIQFDAFPGPAHAVYFATYEVVKQAMGGNASGHHPLAAGTFTINPLSSPQALADFFTTATSGACATIASDAFMNPFDGTRFTSVTFGQF